jgi:alpha-N-arabinofuranosidase
VKTVNFASTPRQAEIRLSGINPSGTVKVTTLASSDLNAENSLDHPMAVAPESSTIELRSGTIPVQLRPYSITVYRIPAQ